MNDSTRSDDRSTKVTDSQLQILQHSLGVDQFGQGPMYRNHFCAGRKDEDDCRALVSMGLMAEHPTTEIFPYYNCSVTKAGGQYVRDYSPNPPKLTAAQGRYRDFLNADTGRPFIEWLKDRTSYVAPLSEDMLRRGYR